MKNIKTNSLTKSNIAKLGTLMLALILAFGVAVPIFSACPKVNPLIEQTISLIDNIPTTMTQSNRADFIAAVETAEESLAQLDSQDRAQVINLTILENRISTWRTFDQDAAVNNIIDLTEELKQLMGLEFDFFNPDTQARDALAAARSNVHSQMSPLNSFVFRQEPSVNLLLRLGPQAQTITDAQAQITAFDNALSFNAPLRPLADRIAAVETKATQALINATQIESIDISTDPHAQTEAADAVHSTISELDLLISGLTTDINATTISDAQRNALHSVTDNAFAAASADRNLAAAALSNFRLEQLKEGAVGILSSRIAALHKQASAFNHNAQHNPETDDPYGRTQEQIRYDIAIELAAIQTAYDNLQTFNPPTNDPTSIIQFVGPFNIQDRIMAAQFNQAVSVANTAIQNFDIAVDDLAVGSVRVLLNDIAFVADLSNDDRVDFLAALTIASQAHSNLRPDLQTRVDYETEGRLTALIAQLDTFDHNQAINQAINNVVFLIIQVPDHMPNILPALTTTPEATEAAFETRRENRAEVAGPLDIASAAFDQLETFEFVSAFTGQALQTLDLRPRFEEEPIIIEPDPDEEIEPLSLNILSDETEENGNGEEEDDEDDEEELPPPPPPLPHPSIALARLTLAQTNIAVFDVAYQFLAAIHAIPDEITLDHAVDQVGVNNTFVMSAREATDLLNQNPAARALFTNQQFNNRVILLTAAETEITTQLADIVVPLVISRDGNTITFNNIVQATHFEISYDFISYTGDDEDEAEIIHNRRVVSTVANTNAPSQTYTVVSNGFVTNLSVRAIMNEGIGTTRIETLQAPLSQTPSILINETFLSSDKSLVTAFNLLVQNNSTGANNNAIMSFLADTALSQVSNHAYVNVRARGLSSVGGTLLGAGNMNRLDVGSDTILNFNEDGSVYNSYRLIFASPDGPAIASDAANRRDRVFYDSTTDLVHSQLAGNNASNSANRTPLSMQAWQNANGQGAITPYGFMGYILNPAYMAIGSSANLGSA
ncbi:MAG: hypothetical protein FWD86_03035, partial [Firmicutes bacterium]|nr:hypothetical protein [Bacillota bacterium]